MKNKEVHALNCENFRFWDTREVTGWPIGMVPLMALETPQQQCIPRHWLVTVRFVSYGNTKAALAARGPPAPNSQSRWKGRALAQCHLCNPIEHAEVCF